MLPRFAPNYGLLELLRSAFGRSAPSQACERVKEIVSIEVGKPKVFLTPSCRGALYLLLKALPPGRVLLPAYTCSAVVESAVLAGREVVTVDEPDGGINLGAKALAETLAPGDIIVATHQYGYPCEIKPITALAAARGAIVIEDIAGAFTARIEGKPAGSFGLACVGSFDTSKLIHSPLKGGFVATGDRALAERIGQVAAERLQPMPLAHRASVLLSGFAMVIATSFWFYRLFYFTNFQALGRYSQEDGVLARTPGPYYRYAFAEWQAQIVLTQLNQLDAILSVRQSMLELYRAELQSCAAFAVETTQVERPGSVIRFPIFVNGDKIDFHRRLASAGIDTGFSFTKLATPPTQRYAWRVAESVLNLPFFSKMTLAQARRVVAAVRSQARS